MAGLLMPCSARPCRALLARALRDVAVGGLVAGASLNDEGAGIAEKDLARAIKIFNIDAEKADPIGV